MLREWVCQLLGAAYALAVSAITGKWVLCYTLEHRGYAAVGSEYLFIVVIYWLSFQAAEAFLRIPEKKKNRRCKDSVCKIYPKKRELHQKESDSNSVCEIYPKKRELRQKESDSNSVCKIYPKKRELCQKEPDNIIFWYDRNQIRKRK